MWGEASGWSGLSCSKLVRWGFPGICLCLPIEYHDFVGVSNQTTGIPEEEMDRFIMEEWGKTFKRAKYEY